PAHSYCLLL
ncbi:hypothetical protein D046_3185B, partial [Vibrio parahaemolyticus V-223/04]